MQNHSFEIINLKSESPAGKNYDNHLIAKVNDHEVRISTMTEAYHWHCHPDSDESFLALEGGLFIDFEDGTVELLLGHVITVSRSVRHRTRPIRERSVNLTLERAGARSETLAAPPVSAHLRQSEWGNYLRVIHRRDWIGTVFPTGAFIDIPNFINPGNPRPTGCIDTNRNIGITKSEFKV